jgi:Predicted transcriptional regulators
MIHIAPFGEMLKTFRKREKLSQKVLAAKIGVHYNTVWMWEQGNYLPDTRSIVLEIAKTLSLTTQETLQFLEASLTARSPYWSVPYQYNPFFTGRAEILHILCKELQPPTSTASCHAYTLCGLDGIGKTQTVLAYIYQYASNYTGIFWVDATTSESISASFTAIAHQLYLPETYTSDDTIAAVIRWLTCHKDWLLIFDNVQNTQLVKQISPTTPYGFTLLTTCKQAHGLSSHTLNLPPMNEEEAVLLLLRRAGFIDTTMQLDKIPSRQLTTARNIVSAIGYLPLAIDQAGSYIEATHCCLGHYFQLFQSSPQLLLAIRDTHMDHPLSVTQTFELAFEQLQSHNKEATAILTVCIFLAAEDIPEQLFIQGAQQLGPLFETLSTDMFQFNQAIKALMSYSLVQRDIDKHTLTIHRLLQITLRATLTEEEQRLWLQRIIATFDAIIPDLEQGDWVESKLFLPHALVCIAYTQSWHDAPSTLISLLLKIAHYLQNQAQFERAESLYQRVLEMRQKALVESGSTNANSPVQRDQRVQ